MKLKVGDVIKVRIHNTQSHWSSRFVEACKKPMKITRVSINNIWCTGHNEYKACLSANKEFAGRTITKINGKTQQLKQMLIKGEQ